MERPVPGDFIQAPLQIADSVPDMPAVGFKLAFARSACPDPCSEPGQILAMSR